MSSLSAFINISIDGFFADAKGEMNAFHQLHADPEFHAFTQENAKGGGRLVFGRKTYDMMAAYWPSPLARQQNPAVAEEMNARTKITFSHTVKKADWANTSMINDDMIAAMGRLKADGGPPLVILGSGSLISQFAETGLLDELQVVVNPVAFGGGKRLFEGVGRQLFWKLTRSRVFGNGAAFLAYAPA